MNWVPAQGGMSLSREMTSQAKSWAGAAPLLLRRARRNVTARLPVEGVKFPVCQNTLPPRHGGLFGLRLRWLRQHT